MSLIAVYGTLRKGDYNHRYLRGHDPVSIERVQGFEMYNLGGAYPYVARGGDDITVEVYDVPADVFARISGMETGAGYETCKVKTVPGLADMFYFDEKRHASMQTGHSIPPRILSGDWFEWCKKYKPGRISDFGNGKVSLMEDEEDAI